MLFRSELFSDTVIVKGKSFDIKASELDKAFLEYRANLAARGQPPVAESQRREIEEKILARLVITKILNAKATADDRAKGKAAANKVYDDAVKRSGGERPFRRQIEATGMSVDGFLAQLIERGISEEVLNRELRAKIVVPDSDVAKFYTDNPAR